ncbi:hypothetical protein FB106_10868 [Synechococcus sp. Ace-Pa]|nr:hypothetical protein FB106_10868 [Synechococcus sp. Ace-Pa]
MRRSSQSVYELKFANLTPKRDPIDVECELPTVSFVANWASQPAPSERSC